MRRRQPGGNVLSAVVPDPSYESDAGFLSLSTVAHDMSALCMSGATERAPSCHRAGVSWPCLSIFHD